MQFEKTKYEFLEPQFEDTHYVFATILPFFLYAFGIVVTLETFLSYFNPQLNRGPLYIVLMIIAVINYIIFYVKKHSIYVALAYMICFATVFATNWVRILNGIVKMLNLIMASLEQDGRYVLVRFKYITDSEEPQLAYSIVIVGVLIATVLAIGLFYNRIVYIAAIMLPACLYGTFFDAMPNSLWLGISMVYLAGMLVINRDSSVKKWCKAWLLSSAVIVIPMIFLGVTINKDNFKRLPVFDNLAVVVDNVSDKLSEVLGINIGNGNKDKAELGVGGGMLTNLDMSGARDGIAFNLSVAEPDNNLYFRSFIGSIYKNNTWLKWNQDNVELSTSNFDSYNQSYFVTDLIEHSPELWKYKGNFEKTRFIVNTKNKSNYYYLPYGVNSNELGVKMTGFGKFDTFPTNSPDSYGTEFYVTDSKSYSAFRDMLYYYTGKDREILYYMDWEAKYRAYVYENYTKIDEDILQGVELPFDYRQYRTYKDVDNYISVLREYFSTYEYTLSPPKLPANTDFVRFFLEDSHKGYCVNFASAAAILLRYAGIPARYVEGFCVSANDIKNGEVIGNWNGKQAYNVDVPVKTAHSWVEVYRDGYGWTPVEFTVGYISNSDISQNPDNNNQHEKPTEGASVQDDIDETEDENESTEAVIDENETVENGDNSSESESPKYNTLLILLMVFTVLLVASLIVNYVIRRIMLSRLLTKTGADREKFYELFYYFEKLLAVNGYRRDVYTDYSEFEKQVNNKFECFTKEEFHGIIEIVLEAKFSGEQFNSEWYEQLLLMVKKVRRETYLKAGFFKKILLGVIKVY